MRWPFTAGELLLNAALHSLFIWGRFAVFRLESPKPCGVWLIEGAAMASILAGWMLIGLRDGVQAMTDWIAVAVALASGGLFLWGLRTVRQHRLTAAFSDDVPQELITTGPFRFVRNPFYLSYLLAYCHAVCASQSWLAAIPLAIMAAIYATAARFEERKFLRSELAGAYQKYARRTGRFLPFPTPFI